jgi:thymidylate kinase
MFIVLEGIDACGKTTVTKLLAEDLGGVVYKTPPEKYRLLRKEIDRKPGTYEHYAFYKEAVMHAEFEIRQCLSEGKIVVCDRYWLSTIVYHKVGKLNVDSSEFAHLLQPDLTVFLRVSSEKQIVRSGQKTEDDNTGNIQGFQEEITQVFLSELEKMETPFIVIETDNVLPEQSVQIIKHAIPQT